MPDFSGFFAAIERALFEVATWVFLIPKTLYLVLSHPGKVPEYVKGELSPKEEGRARFHGTVSPLLLFLLVTLGPFLLVQLVQVPKAPIEGEPTGLVGTASEFRADFEKISLADSMKITWSIVTVDSEGWSLDFRSEAHCFRDWERKECEFVESILAGEADPPTDPGLLDEEALGWFAALVDDGVSVDEARQVVGNEYGPTQAQEIFEYWCSWPPDRGCDPAFDQYRDLIEEGRSADEAKRAIIAAGTQDSAAQRIYDYWCSPPPGPGCYPASDRFDELLAQGMTDEQSLAAITREFGAEEVEAEYSRRETENAEADMALTGYFLGDVLTWPWDAPGLYRVSFEVRDMETDEPIDLSEVHEIVVKEPTSATDAQGRGLKDKARSSPQAEGQDEESRRAQRQPTGQKGKSGAEKFNEFLQSPETAGLALAFLMFPLVLTLATELHRGRPLTQSTIKPAFYAQCLYLSPFVVSLWIPMLLGQYHPEPEQEYLFALLLAAVIFVWLVIAEVGFVRGERSVSRFKAILWLFVPVGFIVTSLIVVALLATQHKFAIVEWVGNTVMVLMLIPFIASGFVKLWRWATRKTVERPFHGGEW